MKLLSAALALVLASCGGGGDTGSDAFGEAAPRAPQALVLDELASKARPAFFSLAARPPSRVNTATAGYQDVKAVGALSDGGFAVVWDSTTTDPVRDGANFYLQGFDGSGKQVRKETFLYHAPFEQFTQPTVLANGDILVAHAVARTDGSSAIYVRRFDRQGVPVLSATEVVSRAATTDGFRLQLPMATALSGGGYVLTYTEGPALSAPVAIHAQRFQGNGARLFPPIRIDGVRPDHRVQADAEGGFFLYSSVFNPDAATGCFGATSEPRTLSVVHYGSAAASARPVIAPGSNNCAEVLRLPGDRFLLLGNLTLAPFSQLLDGTASPIGGPVTLAPPPSPFPRPALVGKATLAGGTYVLVWRSGTGQEIQHYAAGGTSMGAPLAIPDPGPGMKLVPLVAGGFTITASQTDPSGNLDVFTQLFEFDVKKACQEGAKDLQGLQRKAFLDGCQRA